MDEFKASKYWVDPKYGKVVFASPDDPPPLDTSQLIAVDVPPAHGLQIWDGDKWSDPPGYSPPVEINLQSLIQILRSKGVLTDSDLGIIRAAPDNPVGAK